jgi:hypothetical protein
LLKHGDIIEKSLYNHNCDNHVSVAAQKNVLKVSNFCGSKHGISAYCVNKLWSGNGLMMVIKGRHNMKKKMPQNKLPPDKMPSVLDFMFV